MSEPVMFRLISGDDVMGIKGEQDGDSVCLHNACAVRYLMTESGSPSVYLYKYCFVSQSFDATFRRNDILNEFSDLVPSLVDYYQNIVHKMRKTYGTSFTVPEEVEDDDGEENKEVLEAMFELYSANTTIQ